MTQDRTNAKRVPGEQKAAEIFFACRCCLRPGSGFLFAR